MSATATTRPPSLGMVLDRLDAFWRGAAVPRSSTRAMDRMEEAEASRLSLRTLDELGLLSGESCVTDWGLVEQAERLRSGWA